MKIISAKNLARKAKVCTNVGLALTIALGTFYKPETTNAQGNAINRLVDHLDTSGDIGTNGKKKPPTPKPSKPPKPKVILAARTELAAAITDLINYFQTHRVQIHGQALSLQEATPALFTRYLQFNEALQALAVPPLPPPAAPRRSGPTTQIDAPPTYDQVAPPPPPYEEVVPPSYDVPSQHEIDTHTTADLTAILQTAQAVQASQNELRTGLLGLNTRLRTVLTLMTPLDGPNIQTAITEGGSPGRVAVLEQIVQFARLEDPDPAMQNLLTRINSLRASSGLIQVPLMPAPFPRNANRANNSHIVRNINRIQTPARQQLAPLASAYLLIPQTYNLDWELWDGTERHVVPYSTFETSLTNPMEGAWQARTALNATMQILSRRLERLNITLRAAGEASSTPNFPTPDPGAEGSAAVTGRTTPPTASDVGQEVQIPTPPATLLAKLQQLKHAFVVAQAQVFTRRDTPFREATTLPADEWDKAVHALDTIEKGLREEIQRTTTRYPEQKAAIKNELSQARTELDELGDSLPGEGFQARILTGLHTLQSIHNEL